MLIAFNEDRNHENFGNDGSNFSLLYTVILRLTEGGNFQTFHEFIRSDREGTSNIDPLNVFVKSLS